MPSLKRQNEIVRALYVRLDKYERWQALHDVRNDLDSVVFLKTFVDVWTDSESNDLYLGLIDELIDEFDIRAERVMPVLGKKDRQIYRDMPDFVQVYRGTTDEDPYGDYSWSYDRDQALWFAKRTPSGTPALATGIVDKRDMIFVTNKRGEKEVAANPDCVDVQSFEIVGGRQDDPMGVFFFQVQSRGIFRKLQINGQAESLLLSGLSPLEAEKRFYELINEIEGLGFHHAAADRRRDVAAIDWDEVGRLIESRQILASQTKTPTR